MADIKFCGNCGSKLRENAAFCENCGNRVRTLRSEVEDEGTVGLFKENTSYKEETPKNEGGYWSIPSEKPGGYTINGQNYVPQPKKKKNTGLIVGIVAAVIVVMALIGTIAEKIFQNIETYNEESNFGRERERDYSSYLDEREEIEEENEKEYEKGILTDSSYESEFIGIRYTAPDGWLLASESELAEMPTNEKTTVEMQAISTLDGSNVILCVEKLPIKSYTESMYINALINTMQNNSQITVTDIKEDETLVIAGEEYKALTYTGTQNDVSYTQTFYIRKINNHMIVFTVTSGGTSYEEIFSGFERY